MDKNDYFLKLRKELKRVSPEDIDDAVRYYEEYSEDAGFTDGEQLVNEFGTPKDLAKKIIVDIVDKNYVNNESKTKEEKKEVIEQRAYNPNADLANPAGSVFCSHGAGFVVKWDEVNNYKHIK